jgi:hypothetical protein
VVLQASSQILVGEMGARPKGAGKVITVLAPSRLKFACAFRIAPRSLRCLYNHNITLRCTHLEKRCTQPQGERTGMCNRSRRSRVSRSRYRTAGHLAKLSLQVDDLIANLLVGIAFAVVRHPVNCIRHGSRLKMCFRFFNTSASSPSIQRIWSCKAT